MTETIKCNFSNNAMEVSYHDDEIWIENTTIDTDNLKFYLLLLSMFVKIQIDKHKYTYMVQTVSLDEWTDHLSNNKKWKIKYYSKPSTNIIIKCKLEDFVECVAFGFGYPNPE